MEPGQVVFVRATFYGMDQSGKALVRINGVEISQGQVLVPVDELSEGAVISPAQMQTLQSALTEIKKLALRLRQR